MLENDTGCLCQDENLNAHVNFSKKILIKSLLLNLIIISVINIQLQNVRFKYCFF